MTTPRQRGTNPRAIGTNPRQLRADIDALTERVADITALEAHHSDTEHAGGDAYPSEVHLQPNDREQPAGVAYDAVTEPFFEGEPLWWSTPNDPRTLARWFGDPR